MKTVKSRRNLPHIYVPGASYFLTFCLSCKQTAPLNDGERYSLVEHLRRMKPGYCRAFVVMPDHVHVLYQSANHEDMRRTLQALKGSSAHALVKESGRQSPVRQAGDLRSADSG